MIDFVGFSSGFNAQQERDERRRGELAQAFNEFQRLNPTATAAQFQQFIDSMSGGRNYLRGGMPSGEALNAVVNQANTARAQADADRQFDILKRNIELQDSLSGAVTGILLNYDDPSDTGYTAQDFASMSQELRDRFPGVDFNQIGFDPANMFTADRRNAAIAGRIQQYNPIIQQIVNNAGGKEITAQDLAPFGVPTALVQPLIKQASALEDERRLTFVTNRRQDMLRTAVEAIERGDPSVYETVKGVYGDTNMPDENSQFFTTLQAEANEVADERRVQQDRNRRAVADQFFTGLIDRPGIKSAVVLQDDADLLKRMADRARGLTDADLLAIFGVDRPTFDANPEPYLQPYLDEVKDELSSMQRGAAAAGRDRSASSVEEGLQEFAVQNMSAVENYFGSTKKEGMPPQVGGAGRYAQLAAQELAREYEMTPQVLAAMEAVFATISADQPMNAPMVVQAVRADPGFQAAAQGHTVREAKERLGATIQSVTGSPEIEKFEDWWSGQQQEVQAALQDAQSDIAAAVSQYGNDPDTLIKVLTAIDSQITSGASELVNAWQTLGRLQKTANGGLGWLDIEGGLWDVDKVFTQPGSLEADMNAGIQNVRSILQAELAAAQFALQRQVATTPPTTPPLSNTLPAAQVAINNMQNDMTMTRELERIATQYGKTASPLAYLGGAVGLNSITEQEREEAKMIHKFVRTDGVPSALKGDPTAYAAFTADPLGFLMTSTDPFVLEWFRSDEGRDFAADFSRAVPAP